jgi:GNAT superfamily N-acetyltransferase
MIEFQGDSVPPAIRALFDGTDLPAGLRCSAVLDGYTRGIVHADDADPPTWAVLRENAYGTLYPAGALTREILTDIVGRYSARGEALIGFWPNDPITAVLPDSPQYEGAVLDFTGRAGSLEALLGVVPEGCAIRQMDVSLLKRSRNYEEMIKAHGSIEAAAQKEIAFCLMRGDTIVCEASAAPLSPRVVEVGMVSHEDYRRRGYATFLCAYLIDHCERRGFETYWNCNAENTPSAIIARRLGYSREREYCLAAWWPPEEP